LRCTGLGEVAASASAIVLILAYAVADQYRPANVACGADVCGLSGDPVALSRSSNVERVGCGRVALLMVEPEALFGASFPMMFLSTEMPEADVLKVAHHRSASSTNEDFLAAVRPRFAVISAGKRKVYHHSRAEVLKRLQ